MDDPYFLRWLKEVIGRLMSLENANTLAFVSGVIEIKRMNFSAVA